MNEQRDVKLRAAIDKDTSAIRLLLERVKLPTESLAGGTASLFVAEENGILVGVAGFEFYGNDALLRSVAVPPEQQHRGIGDRIVDGMIAVARDRRVRRIVLLTETAERFFLKKGFTVVERSSIDNVLMKQSTEFTFACPSSAVCMILHL